MTHLYFVKIEPGSTNMRTRAGEKVGGVLTPGPHRDWRHCPRVSGEDQLLDGHSKERPSRHNVTLEDAALRHLVSPQWWHRCVLLPCTNSSARPVRPSNCYWMISGTESRSLHSNVPTRTFDIRPSSWLTFVYKILYNHNHAVQPGCQILVRDARIGYASTAPPL